MKRFGLISFLFAAATLTLHAGHVPKQVMYHYCTEVASAQYNIPLQQIDAQMPVYKNGGYLVQGKMHRYDRHNTHFFCRYDAYGKFMFIKKQAHKPQSRLKKRMKRVCKSEASIRWHMPTDRIKITDISKIDRYSYRLTMEDAYNTGVCVVNGDGYLKRFQTLNKHRHIPPLVKNACRQKAASRWNLPLPYVEIDKADYIGRGRYSIEVFSDDYSAQCEARSNGIIERFHTKRRAYGW